MSGLFTVRNPFTVAAWVWCAIVVLTGLALLLFVPYNYVPSPNAAYQLSHACVAFSITTVGALAGSKKLGAGAALGIACVKELLIDIFVEHDAVGWWNHPANRVGGSLQDFTWWVVGIVAALAVIYAVQAGRVKP